MPLMAQFGSALLLTFYFAFSFVLFTICLLSLSMICSHVHFPSFRVTPRCFAALGDVSTVRFLHQTNHIADKVSQETVRIHSQPSSFHGSPSRTVHIPFSQGHFIPHKKWSGIHFYFCHYAKLSTSQDSSQLLKKVSNLSNLEL